jgi:hypothetical protein
MSDRETVTFFMEPELCDSAQAGKHNFIAKVAAVLARAGMDAQYQPFGLRGAPQGKGYSLSHIKTPPDARGLCFRRVYHYPFWQIEQSAERWSWDVAQSEFAPDAAEAQEAARFYRFWQNRLFGDAPQRSAKGGFVYVPLQGKLSDHRPFQICSPLEMIEHCLAQSPLDVLATLHPHEQYGKAEIAALTKLEKTHGRLTIRTGGMEDLLADCAYVVTQNSSVAFNGYFFGKPALLFRRTDFHHIAVQADLADLAAGFDDVGQNAPDYAAYIHWFWQKNSINAGRPEAEALIARRLNRLGWPVS